MNVLSLPQSILSQSISSISSSRNLHEVPHLHPLSQTEVNELHRMVLGMTYFGLAVPRGSYKVSLIYLIWLYG